jgi:hypothetical protein
MVIHPTGTSLPNGARGLDEVEPGTGGGGSGPVGYNLSYYFDTCHDAPGLDADEDGLVDDCEYEVAAAFAPQLALSGFDACSAREPYFAVRQASPPRTLSIFYAIAYHSDCGLEGHEGDSEFIIVNVETGGTTSNWRVSSATLSAHWHSQVDQTATLSGWSLGYGSEPQLGKPLIWASENKHANYHSQSACNSGVFWFEDCGSNYFNGNPLTVIAGRNIGNVWHRLVDYPVYSTAGRPGWEHFWGGDPFYGWHSPRTGPSATTYREMLDFFGFF